MNLKIMSILFCIFVCSICLNAQYAHKSFGYGFEKDVSIKILNVEKKHKYGEDVILNLEINNKLKKSIVIDIQPFYLLAVGNIESNNKLLSNGKIFVNYCLVGEKKLGGYSALIFEGVSKYQYFDPNLASEIVLKPKGKILEKIVLKSSLYKNYLEKGKWEISIWQAWSISEKNYENNIIRIKYMDGSVKEDYIDKNGFVEIPVVENYLSIFDESNKKRLNEYSMRELKSFISESKKSILDIY